LDNKFFGGFLPGCCKEMEMIRQICVLVNYLGIDGRFEMVWELWQKVEIQENKQLHLKKKII
jgi:hypothetical protein